MKNILLLAGAVVMIALGVFANPSITLPIRVSAPVVDGVIDEAEWREAVALSGFVRTNPDPVLAAKGGEGQIYFATDGKCLYLALRFAANNNDPGGGLASRATERDGAVPDDDNIELVIKNDVDENQVYHLFVNARDTVFDRLWPKGTKADKSWNCPGLKVKSVVKARIWECEWAIPLESLGSPREHVFVNVARNMPNNGAARLIPTSDYQGGTKLAIGWLAGAPSIQMLPPGKPQDGVWSTGVKVTQAAPGERYTTLLTMYTKYRSDIEGLKVAEKNGELAAGETLKLDYSSTTRNFLQYNVKVTDAAGKVWLERSLLGKRGKQAGAIPLSGEYDLGTVATAVAYYYPGQDRARVTVSPLPGQRLESVRLESASVVTAEKEGEDGLSGLVETPKEPGKFAIAVTVRANGVEQRFPDAVKLEKRNYEWLNNGLGKEKVILPPFTPIAAEGSDFSVLLRQYQLNAAALPAQVRTMDRGIFADEAHYEVVVKGGAPERMQGEAPAIRVLDDGYRAEAHAAAKSAGGVVLKTASAIDYDGFVKNAVRLEGVTGKTVERLTLVLPFKDEEVPLWHICTVDSIRFNPTGAVPKGEGLIWDGTKLYRKSEFVDPMMEPQVVPYIWLGAERRGLSWCVNNTCGYKLAADKPSVRIVRKNGVVRVEIDIINRPVQLKDGHSFEFAYEATPVKLPDPALRRHFQSACGGVPEGFVNRKNIDWVSLGFFNMWAHGPEDGNWDAYAAVCRRVKEGPAYSDFFSFMSNHWDRTDAARKTYSAPMQNVGRQTYHNWLHSCWRGILGYFHSVPAGSYPMQYSDPTLNWNKDPALQDFKSEWISRGTGYTGATRDFLVPSYQDYLLWYHREQLRHGLCGIYMDDMFPMHCRNRDTSMCRDDEGRWHGNFGIFEMRELVRRVSVLQHQFGIKPRLLQVHMTNCLLVPCFAFATSTLSWEDHYGEDEFQKRFSFDYIRAESLGTQVGCESVALDGIYREKYDEREWRQGRFSFLTRTQLALLLPIGVKVARRPQIPFNGFDPEVFYSAMGILGRFRIWEPECRFVPCYEDDGAIAGMPKDVLVASWRRPGEVIAVFGNLTGEDCEFTPSLDRVRLGISDAARAFDAESDELLEGGRVRLAGWDFALVRYSAAEPKSKGELQDLNVGWNVNQAVKDNIARYRERPIVVSPGDKLHFTIKVRGRGGLATGIYQYSDKIKGTWMGAKQVWKEIRSAERDMTVKLEVEVAEGVRLVRPSFVIRSDARLDVKEVWIDHEVR